MHFNAARCRLHTIRYVLVRIFFGIFPDPPRLLERLISGDQINRWGEKGGEINTSTISYLKQKKQLRARQGESEERKQSLDFLPSETTEVASDRMGMAGIVGGLIP